MDIRFVAMKIGQTETQIAVKRLLVFSCFNRVFFLLFSDENKSLSAFFLASF